MVEGHRTVGGDGRDRVAEQVLDVVAAGVVLTELISGPEPTLEQAARAILALGGLQDVCMQFPDAPVDELRAAAVAAALDALGR
ncbi:hypothetical protein [Amycolatopsis sp. cmx-8-4]|uniref:hypothetical protein n=1 Tax=Amycolatopsis sp. cmx-8-4 TaxID=2790947 RepID=UPI00397B8EBD